MFQECRHIKTNGQRCHGPALRGKPYCFFHMNLGSMHSPNLAESQRFQLPPIEDNASILLAVGQVIQTLKSPNADTKRAGLILYALQIAAQLTARQENPRPEECVRNLYDLAGEDLDFSTALDNGTQMLAPEKTICEPPTDCRTCPRQNTCNNYEEPEDDEEEDEQQDEEWEEEDEEDQDTFHIEAGAEDTSSKQQTSDQTGQARSVRARLSVGPKTRTKSSGFSPCAPSHPAHNLGAPSIPQEWVGKRRPSPSSTNPQKTVISTDQREWRNPQLPFQNSPVEGNLRERVRSAKTALYQGITSVMPKGST